MSNKKETQEEVIIVNNAGELYNLIKTKTYNKFELVQPIMFKGTKVQTINNTQPAWAVEMEQRINKRLDNIENRIDKIVTKNNLKE